jgi:hypothetical protein
MDSSDRFHLIHTALARYGKIAKKLTPVVEEKRVWAADVAVPGTNEYRSLVRQVSMIDLMDADISLAIAESDNLDEEWYRDNNMDKKKAVDELRNMQRALTLLLAEVEEAIEKAKKVKKDKRK